MRNSTKAVIGGSLAAIIGTIATIKGISNVIELDNKTERGKQYSSIVIAPHYVDSIPLVYHAELILGSMTMVLGLGTAFIGYQTNKELNQSRDRGVH